MSDHPKSIRDRFPPPYDVVEVNEELVQVRDANGHVMAYLYVEDANPLRRNITKRFTRAEALSVARAFARVPELLDKEGELERLRAARE